MTSILKKSDIPKLIEMIIRDGIDIETKIQAYELKTLYDMSRFIEKTGRHHCALEDKKIVIETLYYEPLAEVEIIKGILYITPINDTGFYDSLISVFEYLSDIKDPRKIKKKKKKPKPPEHDFEWI